MLAKRKQFLKKTELYTDDTINNSDASKPKQMPPINTSVHFPKNPSGRTSFNFVKFYSKGCDDIVLAFQEQILLFLETSMNTSGKLRSIGTIVGYCREGVSNFLSYCILVASAMNRTITLSDVNKLLIVGFIDYLANSKIKGSTPKTYYTSTKQILVFLGKRGKIPKNIFPRNPYPNSNRASKGETSLLSKERKQLSIILKMEIKEILKSNSKEPNGYYMSICLLAIAMRTGLNTTPLLELSIDCLQDHPLKPNRKLLVSYKRRGSSTHLTALRKFKNIELMATVMPDVDTIVQFLISCTEGIRTLAPKQEQRKIFIYKSQSSSGTTKKGDIVVLNDSTLGDAIKKLVKKHKLCNENGSPLRLNVSRLRKTFVNQLWKLSGNDPFITARLAGHSLKVSNNHYLEVSDKMMKNWQLMGELRTEELLGKNNSISQKNQEENTPMGHCKDVKFGHFAPKNGDYCSNYLNCFRCRSFVVTGDDLHRLFSFYWLIIRERDEIGVCKWSQYYAHIVRIIDKKISPQFEKEKVSKARSLAKIHPHPFWQSREQVLSEI